MDILTKPAANEQSHKFTPKCKSSSSPKWATLLAVKISRLRIYSLIPETMQSFHMKCCYSSIFISRLATANWFGCSWPELSTFSLGKWWIVSRNRRGKMIFHLNVVCNLKVSTFSACIKLNGELKCMCASAPYFSNDSPIHVVPVARRFLLLVYVCPPLRVGKTSNNLKWKKWR